MFKINSYRINYIKTSDYQPKWLKCAAKSFAIANKGLKSTESKETRYREERKLNEEKEEDAYDTRTRFNGKSDKKKRKRRQTSPTLDKLTQKEEKGCRQSERKLQKLCSKEKIDSKYNCADLADALRDRRINEATEKGFIPGSQVGNCIFFISIYQTN